MLKPLTMDQNGSATNCQPTHQLLGSWDGLTLAAAFASEDEEGIGAVGAWRVTGFNKTYENNGKTHDHSKTMQDHARPPQKFRAKDGQSWM
jgi:hypothetical protein